MKTFLAIAFAFLATFAFTPKAEAGHPSARFVGHHSCGAPIYATPVFAGYDGCHRPIYRYVNRVQNCRCNQRRTPVYRPSYPTRNSCAPRYPRHTPRYVPPHNGGYRSSCNTGGFSIRIGY